jgi:predicted amidohydrolase
MIVACGQMEATTIDQAAAVWPCVDRLVKHAAEAGADLMVLPEATYPAYWLESPERYWQDDITRSAAVLDRFSKMAAAHSMWLVTGFVEEEGDRLFNSAAVFDRGGSLAGVARKNFLWDCDHRWFTPGDSLSIIETEFGKLGVLICADARVPEIPATLVHDGAQMLVLPTAWVNTSKVRRTYRNIQPDFLVRARAMEFGVPFVACSKSGHEGSALEYVGQSQIVLPDGRVAAEGALGGEEVIGAEVTPVDSHAVTVDASLRERVLSDQSPYQPAEAGGKCKIQLNVNWEAMAASLQAAGARTAVLNMADLATFAPARCHALDGVQVVVAKGKLFDETLALARAAENRMFVIAVSDGTHKVVDPDGTIMWRAGDWDTTLELDLSLADTKQFTPDTDMWAQRRVASYRLG